MGTTSKARSVPAKPVKDGAKARISLFVDARLRKNLEQVAKAEKRTLSAQCEVLLAKAVVANSA